jgi:uncharacterized membrane protein YfcA
MTAQDILSIMSGTLVGFVLGLVGGGGSIIAVPLLVYVIGIGSPHLAIGTSAIAVSLSALANVFNYARKGMVKWPCAISFSAAGIIGAWVGSSIAIRVPGDQLLALFGFVMIVVGVVMAMRKDAEGNPNVRLTFSTAKQLMPLLLLIGFVVGALSGFFGIGGGFLIVPGLVLATGMPVANAIGTSLVAISIFGATTAFNYALSGLVDWRVVFYFVGGGIIGGLIGALVGQRLSERKSALSLAFASFVVVMGVYIAGKGILHYLA